MEFGALLRQLLEINNLKMYDLAAVLGYDKSYLSKWVNQTKLPSAKEIDRICDEVARFVTASCGEMQRRLTAQRLGLPRKNGVMPTAEAFSRQLADALRQAYWRSRARSGAAPDARTGARRADSFECILATQPITRAGVAQDALEDLRALVPEGARLKLQALLDLERFGENPDLYWRHICRLLSLGNNADVELIEAGGRADWPDRLLIARERCVLQSLPLPFSDKAVSLRLDDPAVVEQYETEARRFLQRQQFVLESSNTNGNLYYYRYAGADEKKRYLLSSMFPIYMDEALFGSLLGKYGGSKRSYPREYVKEFSAPKSVIIFDSALLRYMITGKLSALDAYEGETLTKAERRRHLQGLIDELEDGSRLELSILSDRNPLLNYSDSRVSFFMSDSSAYCLDIHRRRDGARYFVSSACRRRLGDFLDHLQTLGEPYLTTRKQTIDYLRNGIRNL